MRMEEEPEEPPNLETSRLILRPLTRDDSAAVLGIANDPCVIEGLHRAGPITLDAATGFVVDLAIAARTRRGYGVGIRLRETDELLGWVELRRQQSDPSSAELTIALASSHHGQSYAAEAAGQMIDWALDRLSLRRVIGFVLPQNVKSKRLMAKIGMTLVGETQIPSRRTGDPVATLEYERSKEEQQGV